MRVRTNVDVSTPDNIYYNATLFNSASIPLAANFSETRQSPLLMNPSEWYFSIIRFSVPGDSIPLVIAQAVPYPNTDATKLQYGVSLTRNGTSSGVVNLIMNNYYNTVNSTPMVNPFTALNPKQNPEDLFYYIFSYQQFVDMVNVALATAYAALPDQGSTTQAPYITYDADTALFSMWAQQSYYQNPDPNNIDNLIIWFNSELYNFFPSFLYVYNGYSNASDEVYGLFIKNNNNNTPTSPTGYYRMEQEYSSVFSWNVLQSLSFRSNSIPVNQESSTGLTSNGYTLQASTSGNQTSFLTDFEPLNLNGQPGLFREEFQYYPQGEYRLTDLISTTPMATFDFQTYWTDIYGYVHQLYIDPKQIITMKALFRKKSFYNSNNHTK